jgi:hypothetical protein
MRTKNSKISDLLAQARLGASGQANVTLAYFEDQFVLDQVILKLEKEFEVRQFGDDLEEYKLTKKGLFKKAVGLVNYSPELIEHLRAKRPGVATIIIVNDDQLKGEGPSVCLALKAHAGADMQTAFTNWAAKRGFAVDPAAIAFGLDNLTPDELKGLLDYVAMRDDGFVSLPAIQKEFELFEGNIFHLMDSLLFANRWGMEKELDTLLQNNVPHRILASLTTQTRTLMEALQGKKGRASAAAVAEVVEKKEQTIRMAYEKINSAHFNEVRLVLLYNALIGLTLQLRRTIPEITPNETMRMALLQYFVHAGYAGT